MSRSLGRLSTNSNPQNIHRVRIESRRLEALVANLASESRNQKKLLKLLSKLRKTAGRVRDLDVQIAFLEQWKFPDRQNHRSRLLETLTAEKAQRSKKLAKHFHKEKLREVRKRLGRVEPELELEHLDPLRVAVRGLTRLGPMPLNDETLHAYRIAFKRARYLAELALDSPLAHTFIADLKRAQEEIGQWHDMLKLTERAEELFGAVHDSALVSMLGNITRARFKSAGTALLVAIQAVSQLESALTAPEKHSRDGQLEQAQTAAA
ncbi:MAG: CHAD domain-containing protein [Acidobacteria bacterium]|nr:CHAD domain-containing protein [Acidobacteriota bacterium]